MKAKQRIDKSEPYFVHVGYTYARELLKTRRFIKVRCRYEKLKIRDCVKARMDKLHKYWGMALK